MSIYDEPTFELPPPPKVLNAAELLPDYEKERDAAAAGQPINTGFRLFGTILRAALLKGLIVIGAAPSAGKTAFIMQIASATAQGAYEREPRNVLIFSLEMSAGELIARELSRLSYILPKISAGAFKGEPRETAELLTGTTYNSRAQTYVQFTEDQKRYISKIQQYYCNKIAPRIYIHESFQEISADDVEAITNRFIEEHPGEKPPVIIVDYLQLLRAPDNKRLDERGTATHSTYVLKEMCRRLKTPLFAVVATARTNYYETDPEGFGKESGGIEYTADATVFIQNKKAFTGRPETGGTEKERDKKLLDNIKAAQSEGTREMIASIIKNRAGKRNVCIEYEYNAAYNNFTEKGRFYRDQTEPLKKKNAAPTEKPESPEEYEQIPISEGVTEIRHKKREPTA